MRRRIALFTTVALGCLAVMASTAAANPPERTVTFEFNHHIFDFFAGSGQQCVFPVLGTWDVVIRTVTHFDNAGHPIRVVSRVDYHGTLSNPLTGKSVPDAAKHPDKWTDYYAPDGTFLKEVVIENRDNPYLHVAVHFGFDANGNILFDNGRDWFVTASHVIDIQPLCAALS